METYPVLDESGKVRQWLDAGRGLRVWASQEIGARRADMLTPGDVTTAPHWAYVDGGRLIDPANIVFFRQVQVLESWTETPAGYRAAERYLGSMSIDEKNGERDAPIGKVLTRYTIERITLESTAKVHMPGHPGRPPMIPASEPYDRPLMVQFCFAVVSWVAIIRKEGV